MKQFIDYLGLKKPVTIRILPRKNSQCDAEYEPEYSERGKLCEHIITVYTKNATRDFETLIAHELIHAWQEENKKTETHGPAFIKYANKIQRDFGLRDVYISGIDLE
jgi:hypothetical protein